MKQVVVVITRGNVWYRNWVSQNYREECEYIHVNTLDKARGLIPDTIVKLEDYYLVDGIDEIESYLDSRLKVKPKLGFWRWVLLIILTPIWFLRRSPGRKTWEEFKSGLIKHEHRWDYRNPIVVVRNNKSYTHYKCKHLGCNYIFQK